ncbi:MAG: MMPL family transporter, partial [Bdellovibrionales bacterium]|nr:MMPL family transporter [Bdellovibrionales bacterium]
MRLMFFFEKFRWQISLVFFAMAAVFVVVGPKAQSENSVYRLLDEPLESTAFFKQYLDIFPSDKNKLGVLIALGENQTPTDLFKSLDQTVAKVPEIWEQKSLFELRRIVVGPGEESVSYPRLSSQDPDILQDLKDIPSSPFFYNPEKKMAYVEWTMDFSVEEATFADTQNLLDRLRAQLLLALGPNAKVYFGGPFFVNFQFQKGLRQNLTLGFVSALVLMIAFYFFFGRISWAFWVLFIVLLVQGALVSFMGLVGHKISPMSSCLLLMMTVAIVEDFVFLFYVRVKNQISFAESAKIIGLASFFASLTTALGFGSLALNNSPKIGQFALWATTGTLLEWFLVIVLSPAILDRLDRKKPHPAAYPQALKAVDFFIGQSTLYFERAFTRYGKILRNGVVASFALALLSPFFANVGFDLYETFSRRHPVGEFLDAYHRMTGVMGEFNLFFPQRERQAENEHQRVRAILNEQPGWKFLGAQDFVSPKISQFSPELQRMIRGHFESASELKSYLASGSERIRVFVPKVESPYLEKALRTVRDACGDQCFPAGEMLVLNEISVSFLSELYTGLALSFCLAGFVLFGVIVYYRREYWAALLGSAAWGPLMFLALVMFLGLRINATICLCLSVFVGLAGDSAIQFLLYESRSRNDGIGFS